MTGLIGKLGKRWLCLIGAAALIGLTGCAKTTIDEAPIFPLSSCRVVPLFDTASGVRVRGAEDFALDPASQTLYVSAYDRRAVEKATRRNAFQLPQGAIYEIDLPRLFSADGRLFPVEPLIERDVVPGGWRPHGIDFDPSAREITFVNRAFQKINGAWRMQPRVQRIDAGGLDEGSAFVIGGDRPIHCAANDVLSAGTDALISHDHGSCGWRATAENIFGLKRSGIANENGAVLFEGAGFANGVARVSPGVLALAATREKAVYILAEKADGFTSKQKIAVPGGPDNLTMTNDGALIAAVHPSLIRLALHRKLDIGRAPSRIVRIDPASGRTTLLLDDVNGKTFTAATVGIEVGERLILGSVTDDGVLVCENPKT